MYLLFEKEKKKSIEKNVIQAKTKCKFYYAVVVFGSGVIGGIGVNLCNLGICESWSLSSSSLS